MIEETAEALRQIAGQLEPPFSPRAVLLAGWPGSAIAFRELPAGVDSIVSRDGTSATVICRIGEPHSSARVIVARGIAHLLYGRGKGWVVIDGDDEAGLRSDAFARELLAPARLLDVLIASAVEVDRIAMLFQVPSGVIRRRIIELRSA